MLTELGVPPSTKQYTFYDTSISDLIEYAFQVHNTYPPLRELTDVYQALAIDEKRGPYTPAVWERPSRVPSKTDLRQCWFPGVHANCGGGKDDQELANVTMAWLMDQLASIGVTFRDATIDKIFKDNEKYYEELAESNSKFHLSDLIEGSAEKQWAIDSVYEANKPIRPWGLGKLYKSDRGLFAIAGTKVRTPGLYMRNDPQTGLPTSEPLENTNERIHRSVRLRLELGGLGYNDHGLYACDALLSKGPWVPHQRDVEVYDPIGPEASWKGARWYTDAGLDEGKRWVWEYAGPTDGAPIVKIMVEESLGPYEKRLLMLGKAKERAGSQS